MQCTTKMSPQRKHVHSWITAGDQGPLSDGSSATTKMKVLLSINLNCLELSNLSIFSHQQNTMHFKMDVGQKVCKEIHLSDLHNQKSCLVGIPKNIKVNWNPKGITHLEHSA